MTLLTMCVKWRFSRGFGFRCLDGGFGEVVNRVEDEFFRGANCLKAPCLSAHSTGTRTAQPTVPVHLRCIIDDWVRWTEPYPDAEHASYGAPSSRKLHNIVRCGT
ncbi:unnamed protein product [Tuber aestivum]|uniref:Uncharacterized protein n=1 Tax=Tuber aestivum TaxID=59557 RepID=A0A292PKS5_9PEZI|nr:unnamed protein product [Tuber aestivum]